MEVSQNLKATTLAQAEVLICCHLLQPIRLKTWKSLDLKNWTSAHKRPIMLPLTMIDLKKRTSRIGIALVALGPHPVDLSVSRAGCLVFELILEGSEALCAKHFPRVQQEGRGQAPVRCMWRENSHQATTTANAVS